MAIMVPAVADSLHGSGSESFSMHVNLPPNRAIHVLSTFKTRLVVNLYGPSQTNTSESYVDATGVF